MEKWDVNLKGKDVEMENRDVKMTLYFTDGRVRHADGRGIQMKVQDI